MPPAPSADRISYGPRRVPADRGMGRPDSTRYGSFAALTFSVCSSRNARSFSRRSGREFARIATASSPALVAPGLADRQRPDRNPARHLADRQQRVESRAPRSAPARPARAASCARRPCPARCAAPPGAGDDHLDARASAPDANSAIHTGVRCAETMCFSFGTPNRSNTSTACCIVSQSDDEPMMTATRG